MSAVKITPEIVAEHGLTSDEYKLVLEIMGREPSMTELGIFSVMWSEHCSYKSSRVWLKKLPTKAAWVIQGPGENAGVIDIGDGEAAVFKMESHNHPSFIEPYQGAATGVGGIMRDVFTMGARPIANVNALRFGEPEDSKTRHLIAGVVAGIGGYGNCMGVPTVAGEVNFHASYNGNILVNAMTVGLADADKIFYSAAAGVGNPVIYVGAKTGRDGIHGATMASAEFTDDSEEKRPTVQVGDPFTEKLLLEACLELMATDAIVAIQDMGAAGLTSSSVEMSDKGGLGIELDLDKVPVRETGMTAYEIMLSESQERMLMVLKPEARETARAIFEKWELDFAEIGVLTDTGHLVLKKNGKVEADMPVSPLVDKAPVYERPWVATPKQPEIAASSLPVPADIPAVLLQLLGSADLSSRRWVWEQYDHLVMGRTVQRPGGDAAIVQLPGKPKGLAITSDCTPRYCYADPHQGGAQAVAETWRNITATGAKPLAITDNMNFGNPQRPEIMGQFAGCIEGMAEACKALDYPVISGNVSLYNETNGKGILPTPVIGGVGVIADVGKSVSIPFKEASETVLLIGETKGHLGASIYLREIHGREEGAPPPVDLVAERRNGDFVRGLIDGGLVTASHDCADGGLLVTLAEMAMAGGIGARIGVPAGVDFAHAYLFGEDQGRYVLTVRSKDAEAIMTKAELAGVPITRLGETGGDKLDLGRHGAMDVGALKSTHEAFFPRLMSAVE
ncbi:phosphoribosylformylglycinamidine synthase subunit PurL [Dongia soli]|uniref:Phosphoribosylformylglycinamidine synthase subunit PurL n=1 Tax=Dongia soli TaxID=600628 RepID=A0ABU5EHL8_9PROT|nr:phosphoribosylformylglycinamidine synthase subunit PurL [Dongia soli]MDY0885728.1 phosphoribosylformylglycinamidine synthase subunit PurL [Dongia soli]